MPKKKPLVDETRGFFTKRGTMKTHTDALLETAMALGFLGGSFMAILGNGFPFIGFVVGLLLIIKAVTQDHLPKEGNNEPNDS